MLMTNMLMFQMTRRARRRRERTRLKRENKLLTVTLKYAMDP